MRSAEDHTAEAERLTDKRVQIHHEDQDDAARHIESETSHQSDSSPIDTTQPPAS